MKTYITVDPGSCHMGKLEYAKRLITSAKDCGADAIKFQLFKESPGNIALPYEWWEELVKEAEDYKIDIYASVWDREGVRLLKDNGCKQIKFAYNQSKNAEYLLNGIEFEQVFISGDIMTDFPDIKGLIKLYCIPEYPVKYKIDFTGIFEKGFKGFSDHTLGSDAAFKAFSFGARYFEKHFTLEDKYNINCPDNNFALNPKDMKNYILGL